MTRIKFSYFPLDGKYFSPEEIMPHNNFCNECHKDVDLNHKKDFPNHSVHNPLNKKSLKALTSKKMKELEK